MIWPNEDLPQSLSRKKKIDVSALQCKFLLQEVRGGPWQWPLRAQFTAQNSRDIVPSLPSSKWIISHSPSFLFVSSSISHRLLFSFLAFLRLSFFSLSPLFSLLSLSFPLLYTYSFLLLYISFSFISVSSVLPTFLLCFLFHFLLSLILSILFMCIYPLFSSHILK